MTILLTRLLLATTLLTASNAYAELSSQLVGPGFNSGELFVDSADIMGRINLDTSGLDFSLGSYRAETFNFDAGAIGSVTPFLAILLNDNAYRVIAVGDTHNVSPGLNQSVSFGGGKLAGFSVLELTKVYAGIATFNSQNPISLSMTGFTNHDNILSLTSISTGSVVDNFSHINLARSYNFSISVSQPPQASIEAAPIDVPTPIALSMLGFTALAFASKNRKKLT